MLCILEPQLNPFHGMIPSTTGNNHQAKPGMAKNKNKVLSSKGSLKKKMYLLKCGVGGKSDKYTWQYTEAIPDSVLKSDHWRCSEGHYMVPGILPKL